MINSQKISSLMVNRVNFNLGYEMMLRSCEKILNISNKIFKNKNLKTMEKVNNTNEVNSFKAEVCDFDVNYENNIIEDKYSNKQNNNQNDANTELPFINITSKNGISKEILLTREELLVLKLAVNHNKNMVNLCNKADSVRSLLIKGLLGLSDDGAFVVVDKIVEILIKTEKTAGCLIVGNSLSEELKDENDYNNICWGNL